jgi:hypothetical protein
VTFLTTRTSTGSKVNVFHQSQPLTQSSDVTHAVRVVKNVTTERHLLKLTNNAQCTTPEFCMRDALGKKSEIHTTKYAIARPQNP